MSAAQAWQTAHAIAATIPSIYASERKRQVVLMLCGAWREALAGK